MCNVGKQLTVLGQVSETAAYIPKIPRRPWLETAKRALETEHQVDEK